MKQLKLGRLAITSLITREFFFSPPHAKMYFAAYLHVNGYAKMGIGALIKIN